MELSQIILRVLYLIVLVLVVMFAFSKTTPLSGNSLTVTSFFIAVLILYVTFDHVYKFLLNNELVFKLKGKDEEAKKDKEAEKKKENKQIYDELNIHNKSNVSNDYKLNHSHKYIEDKVFA